uniref:OCIA domain-containing protein n=1 Tax=Arion vulgaris TaxID=1028688 RepID=A0A0B7AIE0_9EUPU
MASDVRGTEPQNAGHQTGESTATGADHALQHPILALTEEERLIMKECDRDSFYKRALPLSLGAMLATHMMVKSGRWKAHPKFGSLSKVLIFGGVAYFVGKISYLPVCQQKIMDKLPNSNLAAAIRKSKGLQEQDSLTGPWNDVTKSAPSVRIKDDYSAPEGLDDRFRPTLDRNVKDSKAPSTEKGSISYEELRRRNRQEYETQISKSSPKTPGTPSYKDNASMHERSWPDAKSSDTDRSLESPPPPPIQAPSTKKRTNMWGDPIDE